MNTITKDCWQYDFINNDFTLVFILDGNKMTKGDSLNYLMEHRHMGLESAFRYLHNLPHGE